MLKYLKTSEQTQIKKRSFNGFNSISLSPSIKTYLVDAFILFLLLIAIISTISLASFTREDAAWTTQNIVGETSYQNAIGLIGAWISDLLILFWCCSLDSSFFILFSCFCLFV